MSREPSIESQRSSPVGPGASLLERARERLASVDAKSDGKDDGDEELRQEALKFIAKECLNLPDGEFMKLLSKIENALKRKDAEAGMIRDESKSALKEISDELSLLPLSNFEIGVANPRNVAEYLSNAVSTMDKMERFERALRKNPECLT